MVTARTNIASNAPPEGPLADYFLGMTNGDIIKAWSAWIGFQLAMQIAKYQPAFLAEMAGPLTDNRNPYAQAAAADFRTYIENTMKGGQ